jgi:chromosome segregation ATPase
MGKETLQAIEKLENTMNERLTKQDDMMQQLIHIVAKNTERIIAMDQRFDGVDQKFSEMDERFDGVDQKFSEMDQRFDGVDQKFSEMDERFDGVDQKFSEMDERFDGVDQRFSEMDQRFDGMDQRFNEVDERLVRIEAAVTRLEENEPANITSMVKLINEKLDQNNSEIQALNKRVLKIEGLTRN